MSGAQRAAASGLDVGHGRENSSVSAAGAAPSGAVVGVHAAALDALGLVRRTSVAQMAVTEGSWLERVIAARAQSLEDACAAQTATVTVLAGDVDAAALALALSSSARDAGFATMHASLGAYGLHELDRLVAELARSLRIEGVSGKRSHGLGAMLDGFVAAHGKKSVERFDERAEQESLFGELRALARAYLAGASGRAVAKRLTAWLGGDEVAPTLEERALRPLSPRIAKAALAQLTRLCRALGARGARIILTEAEALVDLAPGRRDVAYTVLRELIDNEDGGRGMIATEIVLIGSGALLRRKASLGEHPALAMRIASYGPAWPPIPHQTFVPVESLPDDAPTRAPRAPDKKRAAQVRSLVRLSQGLPPIEALPELTVGMEAIDARLDQLFAHAAKDSSVFAVLAGEYGSGKTHHLLHVEARALADERPVLRLSVERLDEDLGNPQRHLRRLLEHAVLPLRRKAGPLERLESWLASAAGRKRLRAVLDAVTRESEDAARAAERALRGAPGDEVDASVVHEVLGAIDLVDKPSNPSYRRDAYGRLHLWLELLARIEGCEGPVVILDEAENLYRAGVSRPERRTALRSLAFYCGGALPRACVVLAVTPDTLEALREEAGALLDEIEDQATVLPMEDVAMLRRRLLRARPIPVTKLSAAELTTLAERARSMAREVRGKRRDAEWEAFVASAIRESDTPRELLRRVVLREERLAWLS